MSDSPEREPLADEGSRPNNPSSRDYPDDLESDIVTATGARLHMRPIRPDDAKRLINFHSHLSPDSVYRRYFSVHPELSANEVRHLTEVDYVDRLALIVEDEGKLIGVGRYDRIPGTSDAEVAFIVTDQYQHQGIGTMLLRQLAKAAWPTGIATFSAETQADNRFMMGVFADSGFPVSATMDEEVMSVRFPIAPVEGDQSERGGRTDDRSQGREDRV